MAAFWQWKVAEELEFPADCISFADEDLPQSTQVAELEQERSSVMEFKNKSPKNAEANTENRLGVRKLEGFGSTDCSAFQLEESASHLNGRPEHMAEELGNHASPPKANGHSTEEHSDSDSDAPGRNSTLEEVVHKTSLRFVGEAAKVRPAYKYLVDDIASKFPLVEVKVHKKTSPEPSTLRTTVEESQDSCLPGAGLNQSETGTFITTGAFNTRIENGSSEGFLPQNGVNKESPIRKRAWDESESESVLSPLRQESSATAVVSQQSDWTSSSTFVTERPSQSREEAQADLSPEAGIVGSSSKAAEGGEAESHLSALEEYLAKDDVTDDEAPESLSAVEAAAAMREAVRRMREDAALLALRLSALYASDASNLRQATQSMMQHVDGMESEMQVMRSSLKAIGTHCRSVASLLKDLLLSGLLFLLVSELPRLRGLVVRWFRPVISSDARLFWLQRRKGDVNRSMPASLPPAQWPLRWRLVLAFGFLGSKHLLSSLRQDQAMRTLRTNALMQWKQIAERLVIMKAIGERGLARNETGEDMPTDRGVAG